MLHIINLKTYLLQITNLNTYLLLKRFKEFI
jgi:hypothetical protein